MFKDITEAWQTAVPIMEYDLADKYADYYRKKMRVAITGRQAKTDSTRNKTYTAEFAAMREYRANGGTTKTLNGKEIKKYFEKVKKSKTYQALCDNTEGSMPGEKHCFLEVANFRGATAGQATSYGAMRLPENGVCEYTILHEFAHLCGNMHHDLGFRRDVLKLASRFMGVEFAKILKKHFKNAKLRTNTNTKIKSPEQWLKDYQRMAKIRAMKGD